MFKHAVDYAKTKGLQTVYLYMIEMCVVDSSIKENKLLEF